MVKTKDLKLDKNFRDAIPVIEEFTGLEFDSDVIKLSGPQDHKFTFYIWNPNRIHFLQTYNSRSCIFIKAHLFKDAILRRCDTDLSEYKSLFDANKKPIETDKVFRFPRSTEIYDQSVRGDKWGRQSITNKLVEAIRQQYGKETYFDNVARPDIWCENPSNPPEIIDWRTIIQPDALDN